MLTVTSADDSGPGTLRNTIVAASPGDVINFDPTLDGQVITLTSGEIVLKKGLSIQGPGASQLTIATNGQSRIFRITAGNHAAVSISGLSLNNGTAQDGGAIDDSENSNTLKVSDCTFNGNQASFQGGAIASDGELSVNNCLFLFNWAVGLSGSTSPQVSSPASGGAIWAGGANLTVTNSRFFFNQAIGGDGALGGYAQGGGIAWENDAGANANGDGSFKVVITGDTFADNSAEGGASRVSSDGGAAKGGAVVIDSSYSHGLSVTLSNDTFTGDSVTGGVGFHGGLAEGGGLALDGLGPVTLTIVANGDRFTYENAYGGDSSAGPGDKTGQGGAAYGGAITVVTGGALAPTATFNTLTVTGSTAQGGGAGGAINGGGAHANGGDAKGGGVYLDADASANAQFILSGGTFDADKAVGGNGGNVGLAGLPGGDAAGGGLATSVPVGLVTMKPAFTIDDIQFTNCTATGGGGGDATWGGLPAGGGPGGNSYGGGASLDPGDAYGATYHLTNDTFLSDRAVGGKGGDGSNSAHGYKGGTAGTGGQADGGGLAVVLGLNGFNAEGGGHAKALQVFVTNGQFRVNQAVGGDGGIGGFGLIGAPGGVSGAAEGGAVSLYGPAGDVSNQVTFDTDFLFANTAQGGTGGVGGQSIVTKGAQGGAARGGAGGGLNVTFAGSVCLKSSTILGNHAVGGKGGKGGLGLLVNGKTGTNGGGVGGGIRNAGVAGSTVCRTSDTLIITNHADIDPDIHGPIGNC